MVKCEPWLARLAGSTLKFSALTSSIANRGLSLIFQAMAERQKEAGHHQDPPEHVAAPE